MTAAPPLSAIWTDVLSCAGYGVVVALFLEMLLFLTGQGLLRCFFCDVLAFAAAAFLLCGYVAGESCSGVARWYMAIGMAAGALGWKYSVSVWLHRIAGNVIQSCKRRIMRFLQRIGILKVLSKWNISAVFAGIKRRKNRKIEKSDKILQKNAKKQLQKEPKILYN